jgi:hypothetical protein
MSWFSVNTSARITSKWSVTADVHERRNNFLSNAGFHFLRAGLTYHISEQLSVNAGYAHLWMALNHGGYANENRIYQQLQLTTNKGRLSILQRLRNEQRWQQRISNGELLDGYKFSNRVRYLLNLNIRLSKNHHLPSLVLADELCVQFGKEIVLNTFDQNRFFIGIKQSITKDLCFDTGYMLVNQQKPSGSDYDENHTYRLFFYYTPHLSRRK